MRLANVLLWASIWTATTLSPLAGSYPAGVAIQLFSQADGVTNLGDGSVAASDRQTAAGTTVAGVYGGMLRLADKGTANAVGSYKLPDLDPGNVINSLDVKFNVAMNRIGTDPAGEGWSLNFGRIPEDNGTGEGGFAPLPGGLSIAFDPFDNGDDAPSIQVYIGGVSVGNFPKAFTFDAAARPVIIHWDSAGLDINYEGRVICADLPTPGFSPRPGNIVAFTARTTSTTMDVFLDNLKVTTVSVPAIDAGGPIISEFVANNGEFEDEFADKPAWIEILNASPDPVDMAGWYLTDSKDIPAKWKIQNLSLKAYSYQVVFASGKDRQLSAVSWPHANFTLSKTGGYLALVKPDGTTVASAFEYGAQQKNVSFGEKGAERKRGYMFPASPGTVNTQEPAPQSLSPDVVYSHAGGFITEAVTLSLDVLSSPGAEIRYTLDRTEPTPASALYATPITVDKWMTVKARVYAPGHLPGPVTSRSFIMIDSSLANYNGSGKVFDSNLPLVFLDSFAFAVDANTSGAKPFRPCYAAVISPDPVTGRASLTSAPEYSGPAGAHVHGESSAGFDQRTYALEIWDETGKDQPASLLGMPAESDWILYGPWSEKTLMRNKLVFDWMLAARGEDGSAPRTRFIELFFNQAKPSTGQVGYNATYKGIYVLMEKLKRDKGRLPLENLNDKTVDPDLITGGYIIRKDKDDALKNNWTTTTFGIPLQSFDPDKLNTAQFNYIKSYMASFETALNGANFKNFTNGYQAYLDADWFIDAQWMLEVAKQVDGYVFSTYFHKNRAGRLRAGPLWDFNISLGNADYATGDVPIGWLYDVPNGVGQLWYTKLHTDPDYKMAHWDRYWQLRRTIFATDTVMATIDKHMTNLLDGYTGSISNRAPSTIQNPVARHFRKWPRLGTRDWPNPPAETSIKTWQAEVDYMKNWIKPRLNWLDDQTLRGGKIAYRPPVMSHDGGPIDGPLSLTITPYQRVDTATTFPTGDIYYTLDNSDPRLPGGAISPKSFRYAGPLPIESSLTVKARLRAQGIWGAMASSTFLLGAVPAGPTSLAVTEIMFRPGPLTAAEKLGGLVDSGQFEYLELRNIAAQPIDLTGVKFTKGIDFDFSFVPASARLLQPGESVVLASDRRATMLRYPQLATAKIVGEYRGHLDSGGETIAIQAADGSVLRQFRYDDDAPWPSAGVTDGRSIVLKNPYSNPDPSRPANWTLSAKPGGTPGAFGTGSDTFTGDPWNDADGDGLPDFYEFATGSDPENPHSGQVPSAAVTAITVGGVQDNYLTFRFQHGSKPQGVTLLIESSDDLKTWVPADTNLALVSSAPGLDGTVTDTYRGATPVRNNPKRALFYRLRARLQ